MITALLKKIFGSKNERELKRIRKVVEQINALEPELKTLADEDFALRTQALKERAAQGESLDKLLPESFALVREASVRALNMRHFDVQMIGGMVLHEGQIAEMRTGEGKTLVATLAVYLNALSNKGVHVVTVNDYLAKRDAEWMGKLYRFMGLSVGVIYSGQSQEEKRQAYQADITYGTNNEFGFDYLRDNMAFSLEERVQRDLNYAVIDEVDSILIDEARTPLIISGAAEDSSAMYRLINKLVPGLTPWNEETETGDFIIDEKQRSLELTEQGHQLVEELLSKEGVLKAGDSLYASANLSLLHHVQSALRAHQMFNKDVDYIVSEGQVVIVDEHTGRTMPGRRWGEGLHQAIEAKEGLNIQAESQTLAATTFQNYFRLYTKLSGMTGTADTEAYEFNHIYALNVVVIPTNRQVQRKDLNDLVFMSSEEKFEAIIKDVQHTVEQGQPVLVGTASIETSEFVSGLLKKAGVAHKVLNAKQHESEAEIIAQAGRAGAVTLATNMAGRGTDIKLGGNWEVEAEKLDNPTEEQLEKLKAAWQERHDAVVAAGGLHVIGTERHESRRIDNQLRGRSGRQGDPGSTRFFLSLEDSLMRIFASDRVKSMMTMLGMKHGEAIEHKMVTNAVEKAQRKVEGRNFDIRKQLLEYDDVNNDQRSVIYAQRREILEAEEIAEEIEEMREDVLDAAISQFIPPQSMPEQWRVAELESYLATEFNLDAEVQQWLDEDKSLHEESLREKLQQALEEAYKEKEEQAGGDLLRKFEQQIMLQVLDTRWKEHLQSMDQLRQGIHLRGYAQKNPKQEYKREAFGLFENFLANVRSDVVRILSHVKIRTPEEVEAIERQRRAEAEALMQRQTAHHDSPESNEEATATNSGQPFKRDFPKVGRNEPCPCGSGKKYKQCHGKLS
ncbi:preprotein translocase subunit SecA [Marinospirillum insulare]|uniref:Protein translocase subunit SecA n=1 Tax=Marinospirillum insulare TaxID=217169 RepID=A0ABQ5ZVS6_9GAMM|nr:preprotein translocase subunit SecA [Marinospirillum insulare]GLR63135.1 protein translocase subunit SecA [Marinospirillum insulare]